MANFLGLANPAGFARRLPAVGLVAGALFATAAAGSDCAAWSLERGLLSGTADHCPRQQVVASLATLAGIRLGSMLPDGDDRLDLRLDHATPETAMAQSLAGLSYALLPDRSAKGAGKQLLLILGAERIDAAIWSDPPPGNPKLDEAASLADSATNAFDADERRAALEAMTYADGTVNPTLLQALRDNDAAVRIRALEMLRDVDGELPADLLADLAGHDPHRGVRLQALAVLLDKAPGDPATERAVSALAHDRDKTVADATKQLAAGKY